MQFRTVCILTPKLRQIAIAAMSDPLAANLAHACSHFPSITQVCRRIGINRQQFNKYLSGQVRPSRHNMRRICDFFGVTEHELLLDEQRFANLLAVRSAPGVGSGLPVYVPAIEGLARASGNLDRYCGYYYRYFYAFSYPGYIVRSLARLSRVDDYYVWKNVERNAAAGGGARNVNKYSGLAFLVGERLTIIEYEILLKTSITQLVLYPSYHSGIDYLTGLQTGGPMKRGRKPAASRVMLDYLGQRVDPRRAMSRCGLCEASEVGSRVTELIANNLTEGAWVFEVDQL